MSRKAALDLAQRKLNGALSAAQVKALGATLPSSSGDRDAGEWWCKWTTFDRPGWKGPKIALRMSIYSEKRWRRICKKCGWQTGLDGSYNVSDHSYYPVLIPDVDPPRSPDDFHDLSAHRFGDGLVLIVECFPGGPPWLKQFEKPARRKAK